MEEVFSLTISDLFTPGIVTSIRCESVVIVSRRSGVEPGQPLLAPSKKKSQQPRRIVTVRLEQLGSDGRGAGKVREMCGTGQPHNLDGSKSRIPNRTSSEDTFMVSTEVY